MIQMCVVFAEFERDMMRERIKSGLARARQAGKTLGRPRIASALEQRVRAELAAGAGIMRVARTLGIGNGTVQRIKDAMTLAE